MPKDYSHFESTNRQHTDQFVFSIQKTFLPLLCRLCSECVEASKSHPIIKLEKMIVEQRKEKRKKYKYRKGNRGIEKQKKK